MADYFTKFSFILDLPDEAAQKHALALAHQAHRIQQDDEPLNDFPASLAEFVEDWAFETDAETDSCRRRAQPNHPGSAQGVAGTPP